jgi:hypothetical protein
MLRIYPRCGFLLGICCQDLEAWVCWTSYGASLPWPEKGRGSAPASLQRLPFSSDHHFSSAYHSPTPAILQRLPSSSAYHFPAPTILQHLPFSSDYHTPAPAILQHLPFSSDYPTPAPTILQRLPFSSAEYSPAPAILQCPPFSSVCHSPAPIILPCASHGHVPHKDTFCSSFPLSAETDGGLVGILVSWLRELKIAVETVFGLDNQLNRLLRTPILRSLSIS